MKKPINSKGVCVCIHDTGNGWTFVTASSWKNTVNAVIGVGMRLCSYTLKSINSIDRIQPRMMCVLFNGDICSTTIFCYHLTNASDKMNIITSCTELFSLV